MDDTRRTPGESMAGEPVSGGGPLAGAGHEQVVRFRDERTGLLGYVAVHSTALGAALGGTRVRPYPTEADAVADVLRLSEAMSYKNATAGLPHGGGKAVIIGDPATVKSADLLRAYGRVVQSMHGRYVTAADAGTNVSDMDVIAQTCRWVTGRSPHRGGGGDSSILTALGVFQGMRAAAQYRWGSPSLAGRSVAVHGVGKVGHLLVGHLLAEQAVVRVADVDSRAVATVVAAHPQVSVAPTPGDLVGQPVDVFAPCSLGAEVDDATAAGLAAEIVCGASNNQLAHPGLAQVLADRGVLYVPDFVVNAGGVIQVADELTGFSMERAAAAAAAIFDTTALVLGRADADGVLPVHAAQTLARQRMADGPWADRWYPGLAEEHMVG